MENTQEKSADIIAEMRKSDCDEICPWWADGGSCDFCPLGRNGKNCSFSNYADRLEVALKREKAEIEADALAAGGIVEAERKKKPTEDLLSKSPENNNSTSVVSTSDNNGNAAAMHEALERCDAIAQLPETRELQSIKDMRNIIHAALAAPPRNCDVGTLKEQRQRFHDFCEKMQRTDKACCGGCPIVKLRMDGTIGNSCELAWAQMPYEARKGEVDGSK